jgi:hypothetical protein
MTHMFDATKSRETIRTGFRFAAAATGLLLAGSCGSSPTAPAAASSAQVLPFMGGTYFVQFAGADQVAIGGGPVMPGCPGISAAAVQSVSTEIDLTLDGGVWRGRPHAAAAGSFEFRFAPGPVGPGGPGGGPGVAATATGSMSSTVPSPPSDRVADSHLVFGSNATLGGGLSADGRIASGLVSGSLVFGNSSGASISCNSGTVMWFASKSG